MFVDDNVDEKAKEMLRLFASEHSHTKIIVGNGQGKYLCNEETHYWDDCLMLKVANYKNRIIDYAIENQYDYLFFADSDLVLHPNLIEHLKSRGKEIISEIFWCSWHTGTPELPNVWLFDEYDITPKELGENLDEKEEKVRQSKFLNMLKIPGVYEVGGLGACTLISLSALEKGVNFTPVKNLTIHGEDRFFCIRAAVLGLDLFVDTHYPAYHIYRERDLAGVGTYVDEYNRDAAFVRKYKTKGNKITLSMIVKNEEGRYLEQTLKSLCGHIDEAVIIDDDSTDNTVNICKEALAGIPLHIVKNEDSMFNNETSLRQKQWNETIKTNPDWILNLDADEILEEGFWGDAQKFLDNPKYDIYSFRLYDMWNQTHYRDDEYWHSHSIYRPFLLRYQSDFPYKWNEIPQHCGRFPVNIFSHPTANSKYRIKHFGWATEKDRSEKQKRYEKADPDAIYGIKEQYDSIMDRSPTLREFII
jgi:glycosyltransferase involved in cell wall biosynthesis